MREIAEFNPSSTLPNEFEYVDLESVIGTDLVTHRTEKKSTAPSRAQRLAQKGDVFYQTVRPYQKNNYLYDLPYDNFVFSTGYAQMRPNIDSYFLLSHIQGEKFVKRVLDRCTGTSYPAINSTDLAEINIQVPTKLDEQIQIGKFFKDIEIIITLHQRKYDALLKLKEAYLQNMFPATGESIPKVRFANFGVIWEQRKLGESVEFFSGLTYSPDNVIKEGGTFILRSSNVKNGEIVDADNVYVNSDVVSSDNVQVGDIIVVVRNGSRSLIGKHAQIKKPMNDTVIGAFMTGVRSETPNFTNAMLDTQQFDIEINKNLGATINQITTGAFKKMMFYIPIEKEEREQVGAFFNGLDYLITLHQQELEKLHLLKEAYLQKMFV